MPVTVKCIECGKEASVYPKRAETYKFCSYECRGKWRAEHWVGDKHPRWQGGEREKTCEHCGKAFGLKPGQPITTFRKQKFCSKPCADKGGLRHEGEAHPLYKQDSRRKNRRGKHGAWARAVISRDRAACQHCGATDVELHAHHIKPFAEFPELRWEILSGLTLCHTCHWAVHAASTANGVNSGNIRPAEPGAEDNPEPSLGRKPLEGVTTRGRAYRRWIGECSWCGKFLSKQWSDVAGKAHIFCSKVCLAKHRHKHNPNILRPRQ